MRVKRGNIVLMKDNRILRVTDAADPGENGRYNWYGVDAEGNEVVVDSTPAESIFMGYQVHPEIYEDPNLGEPGYEPKIVVSDMSEVVSVIED